MKRTFYEWSALDYWKVDWGDGWRDLSPDVPISLDEYKRRSRHCSSLPVYDEEFKRFGGSWLSYKEMEHEKTKKARDLCKGQDLP